MFVGTGWRCNTLRRSYRRTAGIRITLQSLQLGAHLRCMLIAEVAFFFQSTVDDALQLLWQIGVQSHGRNGCLA